MIGRTIEARGGVSWFAFLLLVVAAVALGLAVAMRTAHLAIFAVLPTVGGLFGLLRRKPRSASFSAEGIAFDPPAEVRYQDIEGLHPLGRSPDLDRRGPERYALRVIHREGVSVVPAAGDVLGDEVYEFLCEQIGESGSRHVGGDLRPYLEEEVDTFGPDRVWSYRARTHLAHTSGSRALRWTLLITGLVWLPAGLFGVDYLGWSFVGGTMIALWFGLLLGAWAVVRSHRAGIVRWREASLVISPTGVALSQGKLRGQLPWSQLRNVRYFPTMRSFRLSTQARFPGIILSVEGAEIPIADIYDRPLYVIHRRIVEYWRPPQERGQRRS